MPFIEHVGAGMYNGSAYNIGIIGHKQSTFPGVDMLIGLSGKAAHLAERPGFLAVP